MYYQTNVVHQTVRMNSHKCSMTKQLGVRKIFWVKQCICCLHTEEYSHPYNVLITYSFINTVTNLLFWILLLGKACSKFSKDGIAPSQVVQKINMKCVEARRPQRQRVNEAGGEKAKKKSKQ